MKMTHSTLSGAVAALFATTSVAVAAPMKFAKADANGDGSIDAAEFAASGMRRSDMTKLDKGRRRQAQQERVAGMDEDCE